MANTIASPTGGFQEFGRQEGGSPQMGLTQVWIASTDPGLFFKGDPIVTSTSPGANGSGNYITSVNTNSLSAGFLCRGVFVGCEYYQPTVGRKIWSNSFPGTVSGSTGDIMAWIIDDPQRNFLVQGSSKGIITSSMVGLNISITFNTTTGNTTSGLSNVTVESTAAAASSSLPFRVMDLYSNSAPPGSFVNGTDNTTVGNMIIVRGNNWDRNQLTAKSS